MGDIDGVAIEKGIPIDGDVPKVLGHLNMYQIVLIPFQTDIAYARYQNLYSSNVSEASCHVPAITNL